MKNKRVMVVDDDEHVRQPLVEELRRIGASVEGFSNGEEATDSVKEDPQKFEFAVIDELLGEGIDGIETARRLIDLNGELFILVFTNVPTDDQEQIFFSRERALAAGAYRYLERGSRTDAPRQISDFINEIDILAKLSEWVRSYYESRSSVPSLLSQLDIGMQIIDRHYKVWFADDGLRRVLKCPSTILARIPKAPWQLDDFGDGTQSVTQGLHAQERVQCVQLPSKDAGTLSYVRIWSQPVSDMQQQILVSRDGQAMAIMESVHEIRNPSEIPALDRLRIIAQAIHDMPGKHTANVRQFDRVRIYVREPHAGTEFLLRAAPHEKSLALGSPIDLYASPDLGKAEANMRASGFGYFYDNPNGKDPLSLSLDREKYIYWPVIIDKVGTVALIEAIGPRCNEKVVELLKPYAIALRVALETDIYNGNKDVLTIESELVKVDQALQAVPSPKSAIELLVRTTCQLTHSDLASVRYREGDTAVLYKIATSAYSAYESVAVPKYPLSNGSSWSVRTLLSGQEQFADLNENADDVRRARNELPERAREVLVGMNSMWFQPLIFDNRCIGVLGLHAKTSGNYKDERVRSVARGISRRIASALNDILVAKRVQEQMYERQRESVRLILHNINSPLYFIRMRLALFNTRLDRHTRRCFVDAHEIAEISSSLDRIAKVRGWLERFQNEWETRKTPARLHLLLRKVSETLVSISSGITLDLIMEPKLDKVHIDVAVVETCVEVLVCNGAEALADAKEKCLKIVLRYPSEGEAYTLGGIGDLCAIDVIDTGSGVPAEFRQSLFSKVKSTKANGLGLGLWYCKKMVESCGGVAYYNPETQRTTFTLLIPYAK